MSFDNLLNKTCDIELKTIAQDAAGQKTESWSTVASSIKCRLDPFSGGLVEDPEVVYEAATHVLFMREVSGLNITTKDHRIKINSTTYKILLVSELYETEDLNHLELLLEREE